MFNFIKPISIAGCVMFATALHAQSMHGTYTINSSSPTAGSNFNSFNDAITALNTVGVDGAVTFNVATAVYNEQVIIPAITGSSATNRITFNGNNAEIEYTATSTGNKAVVKLNGASYITLNDMNITALGTGSSQYGYGIHLINNADNNIVNRCNIEVDKTSSSSSVVNNYIGILVNSSNDTIEAAGNAQCDNNTFSNNTVSGGYHGIALVANGTASTILNNKIISNKIEDFFRAGIYLNGNDNSLIEGNDISRPNRSTAAIFYGIQLQNSSVNTVVNANRIHDPFAGSSSPNSVISGANGIYCVNASASAGNENIFSNNLIYNLDCGLVVRGIWLSASNYNKLINNTVSIDDTGYMGFGSTTGLEISSSTNLSIINNIVNAGRNGGFSVDRYSINISSITGSDIRNNNFTINPGTSGTSGPFGKIAKVGSSNCVTITDWATTSGDVTSISVDPAFTDISTGDLTPTNELLQSGATTSVTGVTTDILGLGRSATTPTIGAYEIDGSVLPVSWSPLKASVVNGNGKLNWSTFKERNNSGFNIQYSSDAINWFNIAYVKSLAQDGNSDATLHYSFTDNSYQSGIRHYRVWQQDIDGTQLVSNVVTINNGNKATTSSTIYPNPAKSFVSVILPNSATITQLKITDITGIEQQVTSSIANGILSINVATLSSGSYILSFVVNGRLQAERFSVIK